VICAADAIRRNHYDGRDPFFDAFSSERFRAICDLPRRVSGRTVAPCGTRVFPVVINVAPPPRYSSPSATLPNLFLSKRDVYLYNSSRRRGFAARTFGRGLVGKTTRKQKKGLVAANACVEEHANEGCRWRAPVTVFLPSSLIARVKCELYVRMYIYIHADETTVCCHLKFT